MIMVFPWPAAAVDLKERSHDHDSGLSMASSCCLQDRLKVSWHKHTSAGHQVSCPRYQCCGSQKDTLNKKMSRQNYHQDGYKTHLAVFWNK